jgi:hypothetical protein
MARYQLKFIPAAAGVYSRAEYNIVKQILSEDVRGWHACLRNLYNRAYPGEEVYNNLPLIEKFVTQLINKEVGKFVFERDPATFAEALALARTKTASDVTFKTASRASIHAFVNPSDNGVNYSVKDVHFWHSLELTSFTLREHSLYKVRRFLWLPRSTRWPTWSRLSPTYT